MKETLKENCFLSIKKKNAKNTSIHSGNFFPDYCLYSFFTCELSSLDSNGVNGFTETTQVKLFLKKMY